MKNKIEKYLNESNKKVIIRNWAGIQAHPTDDYVHWTAKKPKEIMSKLRGPYDSIVKAGFKKDLDILLDAAYNTGRENLKDEYEESMKWNS